jgi:hypothetical protein
MRQTGNPHFVAAMIARAIIDYHQPRKEKEERLLAELDARKASGGDIWPIIDALQMLDTHDAMGLHQEERRVTHKEAVPMAIKLLGDGVSKPAVTIEIDAAGRRMVCSKPLPEALRRQPDQTKVLDLLRRGRAR